MLDLVQSPHTLGQGLNLLFALLIGHAFADFPLQGEFLAVHKDRHYRDAKMPPGIWVHCLLAHCLVHAGFVWAITGRSTLALAEFLIHAVLDFVKCENLTGFHTDQFLHVATKVLFVGLIWAGWVG